MKLRVIAHRLLNSLLCFLLYQRYQLIRGLRYTGSVNQYGQIQAIGGVNEKIEGFYDICEQKALMESRVLSSHVPTKRI